MSWPMVKLGDIFEITSSKRVHQKDWREEGIPFYRAREIAVLSREGKVDNDLFIDEAMYVEYKAKFGAPEEGDILVTAVGTLGLTYAVQKGDKFYFKDASVIKLRKKIDVDISYVQYAIASPVVQRFIQNSSGATVGTYTISRARETEIPLPPLDEQKRIAAILDKADSVRRKRQQAIDLADDFLRSVFLDMFGDPVTNPKGWEVKTLGDIASSFQNGIGKNKEFYGKGHKVANIGDLYEKPYFSPVKYSLLEVSDKEIEKYLLQEGDLLFVRSSVKRDGVAFCSAYDSSEPCLFSSFMIKMSVNSPDVDSKFLSIQLRTNSQRRKLIDASNTATITNINQEGLSKIKVVLPPIEKQLQFLKVVKKINEFDCLALGSTNKLQENFHSLSQKAFAGEL
ncbi:restriction endonuclease subunit S [Gayadomonas joobiniege]|uniref:restriction endonuclease subunit S n=1 Tax=Gayadomonas joobiniege TaxID=1234606 RepID=UPI000377C013|nr:restriction endonuclease subunit S [Gayadomonas joobiniege]